MLCAILLLVGSGLCWTCYGYCVSRCTKGGGDYDIVQGWCGLAVAFGGLCGVLLDCASKGRLAALPPDASAASLATLALLGGGIGSCIFNSFVSKAMKTGPNGLVWAMTQAALLAPFLMGVLVFHETPGPVRYIGVALVVAGVFLMGSTKNSGNGSSNLKWLGFTMLALLFAMASQCCCVIPAYYPEWNATVAFRAMAANFGIFVGYLGALALKPSMRRWPTAFEGRLLVLQAIVSFISNFFLFYTGLDRLTALGAGGLAYPVTISVCILGMEAYALVALREKTPPQAFCGIAALLAGILCLSL